jgi:hypothetical protein
MATEPGAEQTAPAWLATGTDIDAEPKAVWNEDGGFAVVRLAKHPGALAHATIHVMSGDQARVLKEAFAEAEAMYAARENSDD